MMPNYRHRMANQNNKGRFGFSKRLQNALILSIIDSFVIYFIVLPVLALLTVTLNWNLPAIIVVMFTLNFYFHLGEIPMIWYRLRNIEEKTNQVNFLLAQLDEQSKRTFNLTYYLTSQEVIRQKQAEAGQELPRDESNNVDIKD